MFGDFYGWGRCYLDHLAPTRDADPTQPTATFPTRADGMFHDLCRHFPTPPVVVFGVALLAWLLLTRWCFFHVRFDECWGWRFLLF
jgi:hypothetical protein